MRQRNSGREGKRADWIENLATLCVYLRTHIRPSFEAAHNKFKLFSHTLVMGPVSFRSGRGLTEGCLEKTVSRNEAPYASQPRVDLTPAEWIRKKHVTDAEAKDHTVNQSVQRRLGNLSLSPRGWFLDGVTSFQMLQ